MSRNDMVLFACGSRSMSSVGLPRSASAAARLMAVVVLPTPPFWLAMATIMKWRGTPGDRGHHNRKGRRVRVPGATRAERFRTAGPPPRALGRSHLVLAEVVRIQALQPLVEAVGVSLLRGEVDGLRVIDHRV